MFKDDNFFIKFLFGFESRNGKCLYTCINDDSGEVGRDWQKPERCTRYSVTFTFYLVEDRLSCHEVCRQASLEEFLLLCSNVSNDIAKNREIWKKENYAKKIKHRNIFGYHHIVKLNC